LTSYLAGGYILS